MKLTTVLLIGTFLQLSAAGLAQNITFFKRNVTLRDVFTQIRRQSGVNIIVIGQKVKLSTTIDVNFNNTPVEESIKSTLSGLPLSYKIDNKIIFIQELEKSLLDKVVSYFAVIDVRGRILDSDGKPLAGATVTVKGSTKRPTITGDDGHFFIAGVDENAVLVISFLGYQVKEIMAGKDLGEIKLDSTAGELQEVGIVSTGYQDIPKERITGSVTVIDNSLINRAVSPDLLSRLKGVTNGLLFDRNVGNSTGISVRGRSTINSDTKPLVVIDNFPFEGDLNTINPNDVENVTLLKDAAAASIWGVRAGNGVIVITTKKGHLNQKTSINFNSNVTVGEKPDLYYQPQLSSADFIDLEKFLYDKGKYVAPLRNNYQLISPVIELLSKRTVANAATTDAAIESLKQYDSRDQIDQYFFRRSVQQQYSLNLNGGGENNTYYLSGGFDRNTPVAVANSNSRYTLLFNNTYDFFNHRLKLSTDLTYNRSISTNDNASSYGDAAFPYEQIADNNNPMAVLRPGGDLRSSYTDFAGNGQLLSWKYKPLEELRLKANTNKSESTDIRLNTGLRYKIINALALSANYQYYRSVGSNEILNDLNSFVTRNAINQVTQINPTTGAITYPMPLGDQYNRLDLLSEANYGRIQLDIQQEFLKKHSINGIIGYEIRSDNTDVNTLSRYGYNPETKTSIVPDNLTNFPFFYGSSTIRFNSNPASQSGTVNNNISYYANGSYIYDGRYILSGSFRKDQSNLFGVKSNQKGVPLWSTGLAWNLTRESFFHPNWLTTLQLKASFGYSGNVNRSISAYTTAGQSLSTNLFNSLFLGITNPPNPSLRWEKVKNINVGANFALKKEILTGSIDFYRKDGIDLIGTSPVATQTGIASFTGNVANTRTKGIDLELSSSNINSSEFKWYSKLILNLSKDKITAYMANIGTNENVVATGVSINPIVGYPIRSIFSYRWAGLDGSGNPQGFLGSTTSKDYTAIRNLKNINELVFHGSAVPTTFGAFRNTFVYKSIELSFNVSYKFGYYFRRTNVLNYTSLFNGVYKTDEYERRWQNSGDEYKTNVPSLVYPAVSPRDEFYRFNETTVEKGDHIRLQDIQLSYAFPQRTVKRLGIGALSLYTYANNLGLIWTANKKGLDPDVLGGYPSPKAISLGLKTNF